MKVALVTGASRGIGRAIALSFARKNYCLGLNFLRSEEQAGSLAKEIEQLGSQSLLLPADVSDPSAVKKMFHQLREHWGQIDVVVNNAGLSRNRTLLKMSDAEWNAVLQTNLTGPFFVLRESAKIMSGQKNGSIINISSILGLRGSIGSANYASAKSGLIGLTKSAAKELGRFNIKVNAVLPGFHLTDMGMTAAKHLDSIVAEHSLGRTTDLKELADFVVFVAEQNSASGQVFNFDSRTI